MHRSPTSSSSSSAEQNLASELEVKIQRMGEDISSLRKEADSKCVVAESNQDFALLSQANALRKAADAKDAKVIEMKEELKAIKLTF